MNRVPAGDERGGREYGAGLAGALRVVPSSLEYRYGGALFGSLCRTLYEWFLRHRTNLAAQLIFSISLWLVAAGARNDPVETIVFACSR
jgi:hypothetical protein